ncbi:hypothetical protein FDG2_2794 [Candidatus Protofrankia californiensis]|uniref:Polyketide cyclase/dehydrase n=1 Tax=Candidatus Protofrankia californiensis TaxID=1839754 RepID=A0A1C3NY97_9ACTN|nr:hypothetical protein FDG2_2794 [Candidatus Protofrankia californiensis]
MLSITTYASTRIARSPAEVWDYVTTPANWVGAHPVAKAVRGDVHRPAPAGARWTEVVEVGGEIVELEWTATAVDTSDAEWLWRIEADPSLTSDPADGRVHVGITYTFLTDGDCTVFGRTVNVRYSGGASIPLRYRDAWTDESADIHYLDTIKRALEEE